MQRLRCQAAYEISDRQRRSRGRGVLDQMHDRTAYHRGIGERRHFRNLLRGGDTKSHRDRQLRVAPQTPDEFTSITG